MRKGNHEIPHLSSSTHSTFRVEYDPRPRSASSTKLDGKSALPKTSHRIIGADSSWVFEEESKRLGPFDFSSPGHRFIPSDVIESLEAGVDPNTG